MRTSVPAAATALALALSVLFFGAAPAQAAAVFVETNPSTVPAGDEIGLRASCTDNLASATVTSDAFGTVTVEPSFGFLTATTRIPATTDPGDYQVNLRCPDGQTATSELHVVAKVSPARGPATGFGGAASGRSAPLMIGAGLAAIVAGLVLAIVSLRRRRLG
jgi:hypothetical protein